MGRWRVKLQLCGQLLLLFSVLAISSVSLAAERYVRAGATGNGSGSDWTNACTGFTGSCAPSSLVRGDTYYVADGSYGSVTFNTLESGAQRITIRKATITDHGANTGWQDSFGDGQAVFSGLDITRSYFTVDGQTGGGPSAWETGFGIRITSTMFVGPGGFPPPNTAVDTILRHIDLDIGDSGPSSNRGMEPRGVDGVTIEYSYIHDVGCDIFSTTYTQNLTIQYSKIARNYQDAGGCHGDVIEHQVANASNFIVRYNFFEDVVGSYAFGSHGPTITGYEIYGNIFYWTTTPFFGNGIVGCLSGGGTINNLRFYNNTLNGPFDGIFGFGILRGSGNIARNNIWRRTGASGSVDFDNAAHSHNTCYGVTCSGEENLSGNPFVDVANRDFHLTQATTAGLSLSPPYNTDIEGVTRGSGGVWDRGAYEFGGSMAEPSTPMNLRVL